LTADVSRASWDMVSKIVVGRFAKMGFMERPETGRRNFLSRVPGVKKPPLRVFMATDWMATARRPFPFAVAVAIARPATGREFHDTRSDG
jgi:hypothetical protein